MNIRKMSRSTILTYVMIGSIICMVIVTGLGLLINGIEHANEPAPNYIGYPMTILAAVFLIALFWTLTIWSAFSTNPVKVEKTDENKHPAI